MRLPPYLDSMTDWLSHSMGGYSITLGSFGLCVLVHSDYLAAMTMMRSLDPISTTRGPFLVADFDREEPSPGIYL